MGNSQKKSYKGKVIFQGRDYDSLSENNQVKIDSHIPRAKQIEWLDLFHSELLVIEIYGWIVHKVLTDP